MILKDLDGFLNFTPKFNAVGCYLMWRNKVLILRRNVGKPYGGLWCVPGGKMEQGESIIQAGRRELVEETSIVLPENCRISCLMPELVRYADYDFMYFMLKVELPDCWVFPTIKLNPTEHVVATWLPVDEVIATFSLVPDEIECLGKVFQL